MEKESKRIIDGDKRALSRAISLLETSDPNVSRLMEEIHPHTGKAYCIGVTGPTGAGKSSLVAQLTSVIRKQGLSLGIIAVDPTSPYSGGALLGDRLRMQPHYLDPEVFIRSMATRGSQGGIPRIIEGVVRLLDAAGKDMVIVETVGVGQTELRVVGVADTVVVMLVPEGGDSIQSLKAGLMEIADIYVVNKSDREGSDKMVAVVRDMLKMGSRADGWTPPVISTQAISGLGVEELYDNVLLHRNFLTDNLELESRRRTRRGKEFIEILDEEIGKRVKSVIEGDAGFSRILASVMDGRLDPYSSAQQLLDEATSKM